MPQDNATNFSDNNVTAAGSVPVDGVGASATFTVPEPVQPVQPVQPVEPVQPVQPAVSDVVVTPGPEPVTTETATVDVAGTDMGAEIARGLGEAKNVLIALSSDPSVDELAAAIGLSLYLDRIGKRATAIYSGATPNTLEFLKPEETFEPTADTLQDFVIAINKEKADHLRYKLDGDFVKVYITPYKHRLSEEDLEFSYGDYNVDLVMALDVANGIDLDSALREHGRIMHDASIINVTTGNPGKFGEIEWSDKKASSVSEMIAGLLYKYGGQDPIAKDEATAFLTGIVAATNRFSNAKTTPETMKLASQLMESGANQQLVSKNITPETENELFNVGGSRLSGSEEKADATKLDIEHDYEKRAKGEAEAKEDIATAEGEVEAAEEINADVTKKEHTLLDDLKAAEETLSHAGEETTPIDDGKMMKIENGQMADDGMPKAMPEPVAESEPVLPEPVMPEASTEPVAESVMPEVATEGTMPGLGIDETPEKVIEPSADFSADMTNNDTDKYGQMVQDALNSAPTPVEPAEPIMSEEQSEVSDNPAVAGAPEVPVAPEINGVPEMNYMPMPDAEILPPPPTPPIEGLGQDMISAAPAVESQPEVPVEPVAQPEPIVPATPAPEPTSLGEQPAMQDQVYTPQENDPGAFRIPGIQ